MTALPPDKHLTFDEVNKRVRFSRTTIYNGIKEGTFPAPVKYGKRSMWRESEITEFMNNLPRMAA